MIRELITTYAKRAELRVTQDYIGDDLIERFTHAADRQFGLMVVLLIAAIAQALNGTAGHGSGDLTRAHFAAAYRYRHGAIDGLNPFVADNYHDIEPCRLLNLEVTL